jgi:hypothetical protein
VFSDTDIFLDVMLLSGMSLLINFSGTLWDSVRFKKSFLINSHYKSIELCCTQNVINLICTFDGFAKCTNEIDHVQCENSPQRGKKISSKSPTPGTAGLFG